MDGYAPLPTAEQLQTLEVEFGAPLTYGYRVEGVVDITPDEARRRHETLIEDALAG